MRTLLLLLIVFSISLQSHAQQPVRVEIEAKKGADNYYIVPAGRTGVAVFYESDERQEDQDIWIFSKYDTLFNETWSKEIKVPSSYTYIRHFYDSTRQRLHILCGRPKRNNYSIALGKGNFEVITADLNSGDITFFHGNIPVRCLLSSFDVTGDHILLSGSSQISFGEDMLQMLCNLTLIPAFTGFTIYKYKPVLLNYDLSQKSMPSLLPVVFSGHAYPVNTRTQYVDGIPVTAVAIQNYINHKNTSLHLLLLDSTGQLAEHFTVNPEEDKMPTTAYCVNQANGSNLLLGTYTSQRQRSFSLNPSANISSSVSGNSDGFYFTRIQDGKQTFSKYYNFTRFKSFYDDISKKQSAQMLNRVRRAEERGKEVSLNYQMLVHDIIERDNEYILIAEAYYPEYHVDCYWVTDAYGRTMQQCRTVFDGYRYTHALVAAFSKDGDMLWDNSFEIMDILTFNLKERVKVIIDGEDIVMAYSNNGFIKSKIIRGNTVLQGKEEFAIEPPNANDQVKSNYTSDLEFWYGNYFITYGYQKIVDKNDNKKRKVFYFNKISFE